MVKVERISFNKKGLKKFFSPNEVRIMELLWTLGRTTSKRIQEECDDLSLACVAGTLDRLVKSGYVVREAAEGEKRVRYIYYSTGDKDDIGGKISERIIESLVDTFGDATLHTLGKFRKEARREDE